MFDQLKIWWHIQCKQKTFPICTVQLDEYLGKLWRSLEERAPRVSCKGSFPPSTEVPILLPWTLLRQEVELFMSPN